MRIAIHQPEHLVWLGLLNKINSVDTFVILDSVQFEKNNFQNRNRIRTKEGWTWLTVPVAKHSLHTHIKDIEIASHMDWIPRYLDIMSLHYKKAPFFNQYFPNIKKIILKEHTLLADLNIELLQYALEIFSIQLKQIIKSSQLSLPKTADGSGTVLNICKTLNAETYLSGPDGKQYLRLEDFKENNITLEFHTFKHPVYLQQYDPFTPYMSFVDALFNIGAKETENLIKNTNASV